MAAELFSRFLDTSGNGSGEKNAIGDYSSAEEIFFIQPPPQKHMWVSRMLVTIEDNGNGQAQEYGNMPALTNGITIRKREFTASTAVDLTDGVPVKTNAQWASYCHDAEKKTWGAGNEILSVRWTFLRSGRPLYLHGPHMERLEAVLNDNFDQLISHRFLVQGVMAPLPVIS